MAAKRALITIYIVSRVAASTVPVPGIEALELLKGHGIGHLVPLNEEGYLQVVAAGKGDEDMKTFIQRVLIANDHIADDWSLNGLVPFYSGTKGAQSYGRLIEELKNAYWVVPGRQSPEAKNTADLAKAIDVLKEKATWKRLENMGHMAEARRRAAERAEEHEAKRKEEKNTSALSQKHLPVKLNSSSAKVKSEQNSTAIRNEGETDIGLNSSEGGQGKHAPNVSTLSGALNESSGLNSQEPSDVRVTRNDPTTGHQTSGKHAAPVSADAKSDDTLVWALPDFHKALKEATLALNVSKSESVKGAASSPVSADAKSDDSLMWAGPDFHKAVKEATLALNVSKSESVKGAASAPVSADDKSDDALMWAGPDFHKAVKEATLALNVSKSESVQGAASSPVSADAESDDSMVWSWSDLRKALKDVTHPYNLSKAASGKGSNLSAVRKDSTSENASQVNATHAVSSTGQPHVKHDSVSAPAGSDDVMAFGDVSKKISQSNASNALNASALQQLLSGYPTRDAGNVTPDSKSISASRKIEEAHDSTAGNMWNLLRNVVQTLLDRKQEAHVNEVSQLRDQISELTSKQRAAKLELGELQEQAGAKTLELKEMREKRDELLGRESRSELAKRRSEIREQREELYAQVSKTQKRLDEQASETRNLRSLKETAKQEHREEHTHMAELRQQKHADPKIASFLARSAHSGPASEQDSNETADRAAAKEPAVADAVHAKTAVSEERNENQTVAVGTAVEGSQTSMSDGASVEEGSAHKADSMKANNATKDVGAAAAASEKAAAERARVARLRAEQERKRQEIERAKQHTLSLKGQARAAVEQSYTEARLASAPATQTVSSASTEARSAAAEAEAMAGKKAVAPSALLRHDSATARLPEVEALLAPASNKFQAFQTQAHNLKQQVAARFAASHAAAQTRKEHYELALAEKSRSSQAIAAANRGLEKDIASMLASNSNIKHQADNLVMAKRFLRESMDGIVSKLGLAKGFLSDSVNVTDDSAADVLQVLRPTTPAPTLEHFLGLARQSADQQHHEVFASLLEMGSQTGTKFGRNPLEEEEKKPDSISEVLGDRLIELDHHQDMGTAELDSMYTSLLTKANASQVALLEQQASLNSTLMSLTQLHSNLTSARDFLHGQVHGLGERLRGFGTFANRVRGSLIGLVQKADSKIEGVHLSAAPRVPKPPFRATPATNNSHRKF